MRNRIDELFKEKLENHPLPVPVEAWAKIEGSLPKKNKIVFAWRLAAAFVLLGALLSAIYLYQTKETRGEIIVESKEVKPITQPIQEQKQSVAKAEEKTEKQKEVGAYYKISDFKKSKTEKKSATEETRPLVAENQPVIANEIIEPMVQPETKATVAIAKFEKSIVLEFTLAPIETSVVAKGEKNTGLKKFWATAKDLKNGESTFNLQEFKENLFALNAKKDKAKNNQ
jgi:HD superfamily phosphohydrolase